MILKDDQFEDSSAKQPDVTPANLVAAKAWLAAQVRSRGGQVSLSEIVHARRNDKTGPRWWQCVQDKEWVQLAQELQAEWDARRAEKQGKI